MSAWGSSPKKLTCDLIGATIVSIWRRDAPSPITSHSNPKIKQARALRQRKQRDVTGLFLVEGLFHIGEALAAQAAIDSLFYAPDLLDSDFARQLIDRAVAEGLPCYETTAEILAMCRKSDGAKGK